jgi:hypothetical protein
MGTDYSSNIAFGFRILASKIEKIFAKVIPGKKHVEQRFDQKTGKRISDEVVVDQEEKTTYEFDGKEYEVVDELVDAICKKLGCSRSIIGIPGQGDDIDYVFGVKMDESSEIETGTDGGRADFGNSYRYTDVLLLESSLTILKAKLRGYKIPVGEATVFLCWNISY